jgi:Na+/melibiose symporter-like transporter
LVFAGEVLLGAVILLFARRIADAPVGVRPHLDLIGSLLSALGLGLAVIGVLRSSEWGWLLPATGAPSFLGMSLVFWLILGGLLSLWLFVWHIRRLEDAGAEPLVSPSLFGNRQLRGGLVMFFFQFVVMMGIFFVIPLYLSVALGLSAIETGIKITPLSITMLLAAAGIPRFLPSASPRRVVEASLLAVIVGLLVLISTMDVDASAQIVTLPLLLIGLGMGGLASQLGSVTVSAVPNEKSPEVGGLQNTATQFGASLGTALAGSVLVTALTASFLTGIAQNPAVPKELSLQASVELASGIPFVSDAQLESALQQAGLDPATTQAVLDVNEQSRVDGLRAALALLVLIAVVALFFTRPIPEQQPSGQPEAQTTVGDEPVIVPSPG